jgi:hypothetical protein
VRVFVTAEELIDRGVWDDYCESHGINVWAVNEGLMDSDEEFQLTQQEAVSFGFVK